DTEPTWGSYPNRKWDTTVWVSNNGKIRSELGWEPAYDFRRGFAAMLDWFLAGPRPEYELATSDGVCSGGGNQSARLAYPRAAELASPTTPIPASNKAKLKVLGR